MKKTYHKDKTKSWTKRFYANLIWSNFLFFSVYWLCRLVGDSFSMLYRSNQFHVAVSLIYCPIIRLHLLWNSALLALLSSISTLQMQRRQILFWIWSSFTFSFSLTTSRSSSIFKTLFNYCPKSMASPTWALAQCTRTQTHTHTLIIKVDTSSLQRPLLASSLVKKKKKKINDESKMIVKYSRLHCEIRPIFWFF